MFAKVATALKPGGYFAFSCETGARDWTLLASGRFAHADAYIRDIAGSAFAVLDQVLIPLRQEGATTIQGALHVLRRA